MTAPDPNGDELSPVMELHNRLVRAILPLVDDGSVGPQHASAALLECLAIVAACAADGDEAKIAQIKALNEITFDSFVQLALAAYRDKAPELCRTCSAWSELVARSIGGAPVEALCLKPDSPNRGSYTTGDQTCPAHTRETEFADAPSERAPLAVRR